MKKLISELNLNKAHLIFICFAVALMVLGLSLLVFFELDTLGGVLGMIAVFEGKGIFLGVVLGAQDFKLKEAK